MTENITNSAIHLHQFKVRLTSKGSEELIPSYELLLPLNGFANLVNLMQNFEILHNQYEERQLARNNQPDFNRYLAFRFFEHKHRIIRGREQECVLIKAMNKKSPYWVDLMLNVSSYVINTIQLLIDDNVGDVESKLIAILNKIPCFRKKSEAEKREIIRMLLQYFKWILTYVSITINQ